MAPNPVESSSLEEQIGQWRNFLRRRQAIHTVDIAELEDHLREQVAGLVEGGLASDEAFLIAVKRMGSLDALSREFAREHSERLWKQLVMPPPESGAADSARRSDAVVAFGCAIAAGLAVKLPELFGLNPDANASFYFRNVPFFVLPLVTGYFAWKRRIGRASILWLTIVFVAAAVLVNFYSFTPKGSTEMLAAVHLPIALLLVTGVAYAGSRWREVAGRMDFIRFAGELFIYYVLIALGGGVLTAFLTMIFKTIGIDAEPFVQGWLPSCVAGSVLVAAWLVEAKQSVIENMAPVLTRLFTPLFAAVLVTFLGAMLWTGGGVNIERNMLMAFDGLLLMVLALLVYSISARDSGTPAGPFDAVQLVLLVSALLADAVALWAIAARISEWGFTPNRVAVLGVNLILLVNLAWSTVLYLRFVRQRGVFATLERWQTDYLPVYAAWAAIVVVVFPPLFGFA
ncbi:MAG: permease prefix domain 1-containing protein [Gemmatimonadales bacterium]